MPRLAWILVLAVLAGTVFADDYETRYHDAYKLEVVDGKVADAAARYLDLLEAKDLPPHLRAQAEFRFAVTCALLGRPDEARARLAALATAPETPAALQPQIEEYRKSLAELEPGSATAKRIDELVFQLGREHADVSSEPGVYRDFEIMGAAAVPYLRKLLDHQDQQLREHAFRILCRMNVPGLATRWDPKWRSTVNDFGRYLFGQPAETEVMEKRLLEMPPKDADDLLSRTADNPWSPVFLKAQAARTENPWVVVKAVVYRQDNEENRKTLASWLSKGPEAFALPAAAMAADLLRWENNKPEPTLFPSICTWISRGDFVTSQAEGLAMASRGQPTDALLELLTSLLGAKDLPTGDRVARIVAATLLSRDLDPAQAGRFAELRVELVRRSLPNPVDEALVSLVAVRKAADVPVLLVALEGIPSSNSRRALVDKVLDGANKDPKTTPETRVAIIRALQGKIEPETLANWIRMFAPNMPPKECIDQLSSLVSKEPSRDTFKALFRSNWSSPKDGIYRNDVLVPSLPQVWNLVGADVRGDLVYYSSRLLADTGANALDEARTKELAAFLLPRLGATQAKETFDIATQRPDLFPLEDWLPVSPQRFWPSGMLALPPIDAARADQAARALAADPSRVTDSVLIFLENRVSDDVRAECAAELYRKGDAKLISMLLAHRDLMPADPGVLEETYDRLKDADLSVLSQLGFRLAEVRPSEKLFGLAERLLASPDRQRVLDGIALARSLGRDTLIPPLLSKLDSMDAMVRTKAREAIDSILELKRIKDEVSKRIADQKLGK